MLSLPALKLAMPKEVTTSALAVGQIWVDEGRSDSKSNIHFTLQPQLKSVEALMSFCHILYVQRYFFMACFSKLEVLG